MFIVTFPIVWISVPLASVSINQYNVGACYARHCFVVHFREEVCRDRHLGG
jgi:hypothetical protein